MHNLLFTLSIKAPFHLVERTPIASALAHSRCSILRLHYNEIITLDGEKSRFEALLQVLGKFVQKLEGVEVVAPLDFIGLLDA